MAAVSIFVSALLRLLRITMVSFLRNFIAVASLMAPRRKGSVCFAMKPGLYNGSSKYLFEFLFLNEQDSLSVFWLSDRVLHEGSCSIDDKFKDNFIQRYSLLGFWFFLRSECIVLSYGFSDVGVLYSKAARKKKVLQLWHGVGIKCMGALDRKFDEGQIKRYFNDETRYYDFIVTSSDVDRYYTSSYTGVDVRKVLAVGLPRNDFLSLKSSEGAEGVFKILYAPTFRDVNVDVESMFFPFSCSYQEVELWAEENKVRFLLRPHPNDLASMRVVEHLVSKNENVFENASPGAEPDAVVLINKCDAIITDYSSIYVDGLLRDLPCVFVDFDRQDYLNHRGLAYEYELVTPGPKVQDWTGFKTACEEMLIGAPGYAEKRSFTRALFFKYQDGNSCRRVAELLKTMVE